MHSRKLAVIGLGNTLRRDDGIGVIILESLLKLYRRKAIDYLNFGIASFDLIHKIQNYDAVLLIDGIDGALAAGTLKIFKLQDIQYGFNNLPVSSHEFDLKNLFELYKKFDLKTKVYIAGIQVKDISYGEVLSQDLGQKLDKIIGEINSFIDKILILKRLVK